MNLVFDDDDAAVVRLVQNHLVGGPKRNVINVAPECGHQIRPPLYHPRPAGDLVEDFVDDVVADDVEEVLAFNEISQRTSNQIEVRARRSDRQRIWPFNSLNALYGIA